MRSPKKRRLKLPDNPNEIQFGVLYELEPKEARVQSFYGKAKISFSMHNEVICTLRSYETDIATCNSRGQVERLLTRDWPYSEPYEMKLTKTSSRHFKEFKLQAPHLAAFCRTLDEKLRGAVSRVI